MPQPYDCLLVICLLFVLQPWETTAKGIRIDRLKLSGSIPNCFHFVQLLMTRKLTARFWFQYAVDCCRDSFVTKESSLDKSPCLVCRFDVISDLAHQRCSENAIARITFFKDTCTTEPSTFRSFPLLIWWLRPTSCIWDQNDAVRVTMWSFIEFGPKLLSQDKV